jgi:MerR family transcriptional regulator, redox-sensitive transcriptional activator SoxR
MKIGTVARAAGVSTSAIRYYEAVGLIEPPDRNGKIRDYAPEVIDELKMVRFCRSTGISIRNLASFTTLPRGSSAQRAVWVAVAKQRIADIQSWRRDAEQTEAMLERAATCLCDGNRETCNVLQAADAL